MTATLTADPAGSEALSGPARAAAADPKQLRRTDGPIAGLYRTGTHQLFGTRGGHRGVTFTDAPASLAAGSRPLRMLVGDYRSSSSRSRWPVSWKTSTPLVGRALERSSSGMARAIVGPPPEIEKLGRDNYLIDR